jgi:hypothetical protein
VGPPQRAANPRPAPPAAARLSRTTGVSATAIGTSYQEIAASQLVLAYEGGARVTRGDRGLHHVRVGPLRAVPQRRTDGGRRPGPGPPTQLCLLSAGRDRPARACRRRSQGTGMTPSYCRSRQP